MTPFHTILIVENEEVNFIYLEALIEEIMDTEYSVLHANDGKEAIRLCKTNSEINIVLMDLKMPEMSGFEATETIRSFNRNLPIIAQTAYTTIADKNRALTSGCNDFISKPISETTLLRVFERYLIKK